MAGEGGRQLRLLLWKDYLTRKRNFITLGGIIWASGIIFSFYIVRQNVENEDFPTCGFPARALPSAGMLPYLQSFLCSVTNECSPLDEFNEIPAYEKAKFSYLQRKISPLLEGSVLELASSMPDAVKLLATLADVADDPTFRDFSKNGLKVEDLFSNPSRVKRYVTSRLDLDDDVAQSLMTSEISFQGLLKGDVNRCSPESISKTLIFKDTEQLNSLVKQLCSLTNKDLQNIFMDLMYEINFSKYIKMLGNMYYKISGDARISQLGDFLVALLRVSRLQHFLPPELTSLLYGKQTDFSYFPLNIIQKFIDLFKPTFGDTKEYQSIKEFADIAVIGIQYMDKIFGNLSNNDTAGEIASIDLNNVGTKFYISEGIDGINKVFNNAANAIEDINNKNSHIDPYSVLTQITKFVYKFIPKNHQHDILFYSTLISKLMESAYQVININMHIEEITYNVTLRNPQATRVLRDLPPYIVAKTFEALVSPERTQILTSKINIPGQMFCDVGKLRDFLLINKQEAESVKKLLCSDAWKNYINDLTNTFGVFDVRANINDMASLLIQETLGKDTSSELYSIEKDFQILKNFTTALVTMDSEERPIFDWKKLLGVDDKSELIKTIRSKAHLGKLILISVHGALAKEIVKQNLILQYKISPILLDTTTLVAALNEQLEATPATIPEGLKKSYGDVVNTILLTALDKEKCYKSLSTYCEDILCHGGMNAAQYLQFPTIEDVEMLTSALCNASIAIEEGLRNDSIVSKAIIEIGRTTHTVLEEVNWTELISNIQKLYVKLDKDYPYLFEFATYAMNNVTQKNIRQLYKEAKDLWFSIKNLQNGLHLSVKLGFRLLDLLDHGIFNMTSEHWLKMKFVMTSAIGPLSIIDDVVRTVAGLLTNSSSTSSLPPITASALTSIIPNLAQLVVDSVDIMVNDDTDIEPIISLLNMEPPWPCSTSSLSSLLPLTPSSAVAVRALETLLCLGDDIQDEWAIYLEEKKAKINNTQSWNSTIFEPHLFLNFSATFDALVEAGNAAKGALQHVLRGGGPGLGLRGAWEYALKRLNTTDRNHILRNFIHKTDAVLNSIASPDVQGNASMSSVWEYYIKCSNGSFAVKHCRVAGRSAWHYTLKVMSVLFDNVAIDLTTYFTEVNEPDSNLLQALGFTKGTALYTLYDRLPEFVSLLVNSYFDYGFMSQVRRASQTQFWDCDAVVSALAPAAGAALQAPDITRAKPYLCPSIIYWLSLPKGDNVLFNLIAKSQYFFFSMPVRNATSNFESAFTKATDLADYLTDLTKEKEREIADQLKLNNLETKLANFIDKIVNFKLNETNLLYREFSDVSRKEYVSYIYLIRVVAIANKVASSITDTVIISDGIPSEEVKKLESELKIFNTIFRRKSVDVIAIFYDVLTDALWRNDDNYTLLDAMDSMCDDLKSNDKNKTLLVEETRTKMQICAKNYKYFFGLQNNTANDYKDARQSLIDFVDILKNEGEEVNDVFSFLNDREQHIASLKRSIKYSYELGLPVYLRYLQSNLQSYNIILTFLSGGNWWQQLRVQYSGPYAEKFFGYLEKTFEITDDFLNNLDGIHLVRLVHDLDLNDSSSFCQPNLTLSDYIPDSTRVLSGLKDQICNTNLVELYREIPPLKFASYGYDSSLTISKDIDYNMLNEDISSTKSNLELISMGPSAPQRPSWVTDEKVARFRSNVVRLLSKETLTKITFGVMGNIADAGTLFLNDSQCAPCSQLTSWLKQLNLQLFKKQEYDALLCHLHTFTPDEVYRTLKNDFHWDMFIREVISPRNYTKFELNKSLTQFLGLVKGHLLEDLAAPTTKLADCLAGNVTSNAFGNASLFLSVMASTARLLQAETPHLHEVAGITDLPYLNRLRDDVAHNLAVIKPLKAYLRSKVGMALMKVIGDDEVVMNIEDADLDLKEVFKDSSLESLLHLRTNNWAHICKDHNCSAIYGLIVNNLNVTKVEKDLPDLQSDEYWRFSFISSILKHVEGVVAHAARLVGTASALDLEGALAGRLEPMLDTVIKMLMDDNFDSIIYSLQGLIEELRPLLKETPLDKDLEALASGLRIFHQFKTYLAEEVDLKLSVSGLFSHEERVRTTLEMLGINRTEFWSMAAPRLRAGHIQLKPVLSPKESGYRVRRFVCEVTAMSSVVVPGSLGEVTVRDVLAVTSDQFCDLPDETAKELVAGLVGNLDFGLVIDKVKQHLLSKLYSASELTPEAGSRVLEQFPRMAALLPSLQGSLGSVMQTLEDEPLFQSLKNFSSVGSLMSSPEFLADAGNMMCGKPFQVTNSRIIRTVISAPDFATAPDQAQLDALPTDFCRDLYKDIISVPGGKIIWSSVKPLIVGRVLYTPPHPAVQRIVQKANASFASMIQMAELVHSMSSAVPSLESMSSHREGLQALQQMMASPAMEPVKKMLLGDQELNIEVDVGEVFEKVGDLKGLGGLVSKASQMLRCLPLDRFEAARDEHELMLQAAKLKAINEFSAGIVFLDVDELDSLTNVQYKIRMDIENGPTTARKKSYFWIPGPDSSFIEHMRYFRGFVQIQDIMDKAIIQLAAEGSRSKRDTERDFDDWALYTQQEPYPCYRKDFFQTSLYESQSLLVAFFFSLLFTVASAVRFIVLDKETGNTMLMSVMGVNLSCVSLSWLAWSCAELAATAAVLTAVLRWGLVLPRTEPSLVFALLLLFGLAVLSFCYLLSKLFKSASFAAVCSGLAYLVSFMPFVLVLSLEAVMDSSLKMLVCLSMSSSLCYAFLYITRLEARGVGASWAHVWATPGDDMSIARAAGMIALDALIYFAIGYLIDRYYGIKSIRSGVTTVNAEPGKAGVSVVGLRKEFGAKVALNDVSLELRQGQVTALLGHNGAGKTTLINILCGMSRATRGSVTIRASHGTARLGVCPQHDVLFAALTPREHIALYAQLRGDRAEHDVRDEVDRMLSVLSLEAGRDVSVSRLSGGTRRRLCVALAFVGRPTLVVLDEPTAGVDPSARRDIWALIERLKAERTVLLTTHHMDEAELLSDQVIIMHKGRIHTTGSPIEIRRSLGTGYKLAISLADRRPDDWTSEEEKAKKLLALVREKVANASVTDVGHGHVEINLPFYDEHGADNNFQSVCSLLEDSDGGLVRGFTMDCSSLEQVFFDICHRADNTPEYDTPESPEPPETEEYPSKSASRSSVRSEGALVESGGARRGTWGVQLAALLRARAIHHARNKWLMVMLVALPSLFVAVAMAFATIRPPPNNEVSLQLTTDLYAGSTQYIVPNPSILSDSVDPMFAQRVMNQLLMDKETRNWTTQDTPVCECKGTRQECQLDANVARPEMMLLPDSSTLNDWLVNSHDTYIEKRYGGFTSTIRDNKTYIVAWYNNKGYHALPSVLSAASNALLRAVTGANRTITTYTHPLKISKEQISKDTVYQHIADAGISALVLVAYSLVSAGGAVYAVAARTRCEKRLQLLSGVPPALLAATALLWDGMIIAVNVLITGVVMWAFGFPVFVERNNLPAICLLLLLYGLSCSTLVHCCEKLFREASLANMLLFCGNTFLGLSGIVTLLILDIISESDATDNARWWLHKVFLLSPQFALADGMIAVARNTIQAQVLSSFGIDTYQDPLRSSLLAPHTAALAGVGVALATLNLLLEYGRLQWLADRWGVPARAAAAAGKRLSPEPADVAAERRAVLAASHAAPPLALQTIGNINRGFVASEGKHDSMQVEPAARTPACLDLGKAYGSRVAVRALTLAIPPGQCTALLGENGAGKSTTFAMLTGETRPTRGRVLLPGAGGPTSGFVSYCPQTDAVDPLLTVRETLDLYCRLRGITARDEVISRTLEWFELRRYERVRSGRLSGGNRRKLCTALAFAARAPLVLLDEPTSGMDPWSRRVVSRAARRAAAAGRSVLVSTHALADARALAARIALMRAGELAAVAAGDELLHRFGGGYVAACRTADARAAWRCVRHAAPHAQLRLLHPNDLHFLIPSIITVEGKEVATRLSSVFALLTSLQAAGDIQDYTLNQSSLEQMFLSFSNKLVVPEPDLEPIPAVPDQLDSVTSL